ncbi:MAG: YkgJ family cysteine cluster protein [Deltaproteobacteria bacterium]|jgi:Fe-S-cluster containining protein|nr:YkgJ family cysteine cluster protein [Deltaproteobacteria bacterium]
MSENGEQFDASASFLDSLPELQAGQSFLFACNERVPCFNRCCSELTLPLSPYDVLRLRRNLGIGGDVFIKRLAVVQVYPDTGFPLPLLKMLDGPDELCPFVTPAGCAVYEDRSAACRSYPLGRGTKPGLGDTVEERFFLVREDHCRGFDAGRQWTAPEWIADQGLEPYNRSNDRYMRLMAMVKASGQPVSERMATMCLLAFFQLDRFKDFMENMGVLDKVEIADERRKAVQEDEEARLEFAFDWIELVLFGGAEGLKRKERV